MSTAPASPLPARLCPYCYAGTTAESATCWLCQSQLPPYADRLPADYSASTPVAGRPELRAARPRSKWSIEPDFVLWSISAIIACLVVIVVIVDVGYFGGLGYGILATIACAPVMAGLAIAMWIRRPREAATEPPGGMVRGERSESSRVADVVGGVAMTVGAVLALVILIAVLILALLVLLFIACLVAVGA